MERVGRKVQDGGNICIFIADPLHQKTEINMILLGNYTPIKKKHVMVAAIFRMIRREILCKKSQNKFRWKIKIIMLNNNNNNKNNREKQNYYRS